MIEARAEAEVGRGRVLARLGLLVLVLGAVAWGARASGVPATLDGMRAVIHGLGAPGFVLVFALGELAHVPGLVFVGAAVAAWGPVEGGLIAALGSFVSLSLGFLVVRAAGGSPLRLVRSGLLSRALAHLDRRPVLTVAALRVAFFVSPPVSHALALSGIRFRDYFLGSVIGLVPPLALLVALFSRVLPPS